MINRIGPFIFEILLGIIIGAIIGSFLELNTLYDWIKNHDNQILSIYVILVTISAGFTLLILNENDKEFIKFLIKNNADYWYRSASLFNLGTFLLGAILTIILPTIEFNNYLLWITLCIIGINIIQIFTTLILIYNYTDLKRTFMRLS